MSYKKIELPWGKIIPERAKYIGTNKVSIVSVNFAMGLIDLAFHDLQEIVFNITTSDEAHIFLWKTQSEVVKENNNFEAIIVETNDWMEDDGPNHCGLRLESLEWDKPSIVAPIRGFFKRFLGLK